MNHMSDPMQTSNRLTTSMTTWNLMKSCQKNASNGTNKGHNGHAQEFNAATPILGQEVLAVHLASRKAVPACRPPPQQGPDWLATVLWRFCNRWVPLRDGAGSWRQPCSLSIGSGAAAICFVCDCLAVCDGLAYQTACWLLSCLSSVVTNGWVAFCLPRVPDASWTFVFASHAFEFLVECIVGLPFSQCMIGISELEKLQMLLAVSRSYSLTKNYCWKVTPGQDDPPRKQLRIWSI